MNYEEISAMIDNQAAAIAAEIEVINNRAHGPATATQIRQHQEVFDRHAAEHQFVCATARAQ